MPPEQDNPPSPAEDANSPAAGAPAPADASASPAPDAPQAEAPKPEPTSLYDAVRSAVEEARPKDPPADDAPEGPATPDPAPDAADPNAPPAEPENQEVTTADLADIKKPSVRKRLETLIEQRNANRQEAEAMRPDADAWRATRDFLTEKRIAPDDYNRLLGVGALFAAGDYASALSIVEPYYQALLTATGKSLPPEIQQRVDDGVLPEDQARELVQARTAADTARAQAQLAQQQARDVQQQSIARGVMSAVTTWEDGIKVRDPDYSRKQDAVLRVARGLAAERGQPTTPEAAVQLAALAYAEVNKVFGAGRPAPQPTRPSPTSIHTPSQVQPEPRSLRDAMIAGMRKAHAG